MPLTMQAKLLRVLEEGEVERVGGDKPVRVDARVIVATHRNLEELVKQNAFRQDLFHRIYVFPLALPSLRERVDDIPALVQHFARQVSAQNGWKEKPIDPAAIQELQHYAWPGNVRELRNVVERLLLIAAGESVTVEDVRVALPRTADGHGGTASGAAGFSCTLAERVEKFERESLVSELAKHGYHMTNAARALGLERSHLYKKCQQLGIDLRELRKAE
jgi:DNA-binding NtrC family response regulator